MRQGMWEEHTAFHSLKLHIHSSTCTSRMSRLCNLCVGRPDQRFLYINMCYCLGNYEPSTLYRSCKTRMEDILIRHIRLMSC